jgi:hypothetical protein
MMRLPSIRPGLTFALCLSLAACGSSGDKKDASSSGGKDSAAGGTGGGGAGRGGSGGGGAGGGSAGAGGSGGTAGSGGAGGMPARDAGVAMDAPKGAVGNPLLDDFEDCDNNIAAVDGRASGWFQYVDMLGSTLMPMGGTIMPAMMGAPGSTKCSLHLSGMTIQDAAAMKYGYAGAGFVFGDTFNASGYAGISFMAKGTGRVRAAIVTVATTGKDNGGSCESNCGDNFGIEFSMLSADWKRYDVRWTDAKQGGWGTPATFDPAQMRGFQFEFTADNKFDVYLDDVKFILPGSATPDAGGASPDAARDATSGN